MEPNTPSSLSILGWALSECYLELDNLHHEASLAAASWQTEYNLQEDESAKNLNNVQKYVLRLAVEEKQLELALIPGDVPHDICKMLKSFQSKSASPLLTGSLITLTVHNPLVYTVETPEKIQQPRQQPHQLPQVTPLPQLLLPEPGNARVSKAWVPFNSDEYTKIAPPHTSRVEPFCLYIDQIRFVPDTTTIVKVTGRFLQTDHDAEIPDLLLIPDVESEPRSPSFRSSSRIVVNSDRKMLLSHSSILILRVYTLLKTSLELAVIGNCLVPIFDKNEDILKTGCFQQRLRNKLPDLGLVDTARLDPNSLDTASFIDAVSIIYRIWPYTETPLPAPIYSLGVYDSSSCHPTDFEWDTLELYHQDTQFSTQYRDIVREIKLRDADPEFKDTAVTHTFMLTYIPQRLDVNLCLPENQAPRHISRQLMFHYRVEKGLHFRIDRVYGLTVDMMLFASTKIIRSSQTMGVSPKLAKGHGLDQFYITSVLDTGSPMRSTRWTDPYKEIHPFFDEKALLIIQVWGVHAFVKDGQFFDKKSREKITKLTKDNSIGWTAIEMFHNGFLRSGEHRLPLYQNRLHVALIRRLQKQSLETVLQQDPEFQDTDADSISVFLLDGHKTVEEHGVGLPTYTEIIDCLSEKKEAYTAAFRSANIGKTVQQELNDEAMVAAAGQLLPENTNNSTATDTTEFQMGFTSLADSLVNSVPQNQPYLPVIL